MLRKQYIPDLTPIKPDNSNYDAISFAHNTIVELKCRRRHYQQFMIEKVRYDRLMKIALIEQMGCLYIVSSPSGVWSFDLMAMVEPEWSKKILPKKSTWSTGNKMMEKEVGYWDVNDGLNITHLL
jgi:hypothetical protein